MEANPSEPQEEEVKAVKEEKDLTKFPWTLNAEEDKCYGCILGAFTGDSLGSYLEFSQKQSTDA